MVDLQRRSVLRGAVAAGGALVAGPFVGFAARADAHGRPPVANVHPWARSPTSATASSGSGCRRASGTARSTTPNPGDARRRHRAARASRRHGRVPRTARQLHPGAQPRDQRRPPAFGPGTPYDARARAARTTVEVTRYGQVVRGFTSLNGTQMNCSGGPMPWGSWMTCEETVNGPDVGPDFTGGSNVALTKRHGFVFEVPVGGQSDREPITRAGRFAHESVAFDPHEGALYLSEDNFGWPSGFYRYVPKRNPMRTGRLDNQGRLQMLKIKRRNNLDLAITQPARRHVPGRVGRHRRPGTRRSRTRPASRRRPRTTPRSRTSSRQGWAQGAAYFSRLEGTVYDRGDGLLHVDPGRRPGGDVARPDRRRVRQRARAGVGVPHPVAHAEPRLRVARPTCSTSPTTSPPARAARWWSARTTPTTTTCAA